MNELFPFGFPPSTAFYLTLYVVTLLIHVVFMNYVLAGATYLFLANGMGRDRCEVCVWQQVLKDWLPFATGLAITAGVAPLLFLQILYQREFYTANLLLSHRWMAILPVLLVCFYLLYLQKSAWLSRRSAVWTIAVRTGVFLGFSFIAWSWTENHLLSLDVAAWPGIYARGDLFYRSWEVPSRLAVWYLGAFPTLAVCLMWQTHWTPNRPLWQTPAAVRRVGLTGLGGLLSAGVMAAIYASSITATWSTTEFTALARPYLIVAVLGAVMQSAGWSVVLIQGQITLPARWSITMGWLGTLLGMTVVREALRLVILKEWLAVDFHASAARIGGLVAFLVFSAGNAVLIGWAIFQVRRQILSPSAAKTSDHSSSKSA